MAPKPPPPTKKNPFYLGESSKCSLFIEFTLYLKQVGYEGGMLERKRDQNRCTLVTKKRIISQILSTMKF